MHVAVARQHEDCIYIFQPKSLGEPAIYRNCVRHRAIVPRCRVMLPPTLHRHRKTAQTAIASVGDAARGPDRHSTFRNCAPAAAAEPRSSARAAHRARGGGKIRQIRFGNGAEDLEQVGAALRQRIGGRRLHWPQRSASCNSGCTSSMVLMISAASVRSSAKRYACEWPRDNPELTSGLLRLVDACSECGWAMS